MFWQPFKILVDRRSQTNSFPHNLLLKCSKRPVKTVQVNVKELICIPCVLHLELVLMIVLVLQSFLAVSTQDSFLSCVYSIVTILYLLYLTHRDSLSAFPALTLKHFNSHCVFRLYNLAEAVSMCLLDLLEAYWICLSANSFCKLFTMFLLIQQVLWAINKGCSQAVTLYSSQYRYSMVILSCGAEKILEFEMNSPSTSTSIIACNFSFTNRPSGTNANPWITAVTPWDWRTSTLTASQRELNFTGAELK